MVIEVVVFGIAFCFISVRISHIKIQTVLCTQLQQQQGHVKLKELSP